MFKRPSVKDTEEDLLRQQTEFLKETKKEPSIEKPAEPTRRVNVPIVDNRLGIIGEIFERKINLAEDIAKIKISETPFPATFHVDAETMKLPKVKKKSLFALKMEGSFKKDVMECDMTVDVPHNIPQPEEVMDVHTENIAKIRSMTREEILSEKKSVEGMLSPEMLNFLKKRGANQKVDLPEKSGETPRVEQRLVDVKDVKKNLLKTVASEWIDMDRIEPEKLEWIGDIPDAKTLEPDKPYSARFDFSGDLLPFQLDIDVRTSLHHHGDEPERPGYTIQELYQLSRSTVLQQRILALNTLANIIRKTKMGYYDQCFDGVLLKKLVESDVFFLLRFSMDDRTVIPAAVNCLNEFFSCRSDEVCLDRLLNVTDDDEEPTLLVPFEVDTDTEEADLKDNLILEQDIVKGVLRTDILVRFNYILKEFSPDQIAKSRMFETIIRICRHSQESCEKVLTTPGLMPSVFENIYSTEPLHQAVKLLRVLVSTSSKNARTLMPYYLSFILKFIDMDAPVFKLKLECLALWKAFIRWDLMLNDFSGFSPCLTRLLFFYVEKVDVTHGRFDFELFSGIVSLINAVVSKQIRVDKHYDALLQKCLHKWFTQLHSNSCNYSTAKAVGAALRFFTLKYSIHGIESSDADFLKHFGALLSSWLKSDIFIKMSQNFKNHSHIQKLQSVDRDPSNLPSLLAVYPNGSGYVAFLNDSSCLPLLISLANFLMKFFDISKESKPLLETFVSSMDFYFQKTLSCPENSSWFSRYEAKLLAAITEAHAKLKSSKSAFFCCQCLPFFRLDDKLIVNIVKAFFEANSWLSDASSIYINRFQTGPNTVHCHNSSNVPRDWLFSPIAKDPLKVLSLLSMILEKSPELISGVSPTIQYYRLCHVLLDEDNIFNSQIEACLDVCLQKIVLSNFFNLDLTIRVSEKKSFYELFTELITQYAATSYGNSLFAKFVTLPLAQRFDVSFRKLLWSEYMHVVRVIYLPGNVCNFVTLNDFVVPVETDESLLVIYLNAIAKNVVTAQRNGFIYSIAVENIRKYLKWPGKDEQLSKFLISKIDKICDDALKEKLFQSI